jgi:hypothetical protein
MAATAVGRPMLLSDLLCFTVNKFGRTANKPLKAVLLDFYSPEDISAAKDLLMSEVDKILLDKWHKPPRRRKDSLNRMTTEIDDILAIIASADNCKVIDQLPLFVASDPDKMPSIKLTEGDLAVVLLKLSNIESSQDFIRKEIDEMKISDNKYKQLHVQQKPQTSTVMKHPVHVDAIVELDVAANACETTDGTETDDNDGFTIQKGKKRKKISSSPGSNLPAANSYSSKLSTDLPPNAKPGVKSRPSTMIGVSSTCSLKASKTLIVKKAVFRLGNIDSVYSVPDIENHIRSIGVNILSCFELKQSDSHPLDNKAFRVCIVAADSHKLCDNSNWSVGVSLRQWIHKPKDSTAATSATVNESASGSSVKMSCTNSDQSTETTAGAAQAKYSSDVSDDMLTHETD